MATELTPTNSMSSHSVVPRYVSYQWDAVTGGYPLGNGYRMYLPRLMRFTTPDHESPFGLGGINGYAYCEGDPINVCDPSGRFGETDGVEPTIPPVDPSESNIAMGHVSGVRREDERSNPIVNNAAHNRNIPGPSARPSHAVASVPQQEYRPPHKLTLTPKGEIDYLKVFNDALERGDIHTNVGPYKNWNVYGHEHDEIFAVWENLHVVGLNGAPLPKESLVIIAGLFNFTKIANDALNGKYFLRLPATPELALYGLSPLAVYHRGGRPIMVPFRNAGPDSQRGGAFRTRFWQEYAATIAELRTFDPFYHPPGY